MGRRSINTTKSGKFMNPTDQARKEARKRELKKNKRQRMMVRQAVLKNKDPTTIMSELQALDGMEFDPLNPPPYNIKVLHEKRRKLKETWDRVMRLYSREDAAKVNEMKVMEADYELRRRELCNYYESVVQAQRVKVDDIPLPEYTSSHMLSYMISPSEIPLPAGNGCLSMPNPISFSHNAAMTKASVNTSAIAAATAAAAAVVAAKPEIAKQQVQSTQSILKKSSINTDLQISKSPIRRQTFTQKKPPGPPPGAPPDLSDYSDTDSDSETASNSKTSFDLSSAKKTKKLRFADVDTIDESAQFSLLQNAIPSNQDMNVSISNTNYVRNLDAPRQVISSDSSLYKQQIAMAAAAAARTAINRSAVNLPHLSDVNVSSRQQHMVNRGFTHNQTDIPSSINSNNFTDPMLIGNNTTNIPVLSNSMRGEMRIPSNNLPAMSLMQTPSFSQTYQGLGPPVNVFDAVMNMSKQSIHQNTNRSGIIEAKPQIRNRMASIIKLVPTVLKVKRSENKGDFGNFNGIVSRIPIDSNCNPNRRTTDVAYDAFMKEMENVLK